MSAARICNLWNSEFKAPEFAERRANNVPVRMKVMRLRGSLIRSKAMSGRESRLRECSQRQLLTDVLYD